MIRTRFDYSLGDFQLSVDTEIPSTGISAIYGVSGSGKTTYLRCIAGLEKVQDGTLFVNGQQWQDNDTLLPTHKRPIGYVFQESSLFAHLNVEGNLEYAEKRARHLKPIISREKVVSLLGIAHLLPRQTRDLSGGERQRVAIARTLLAAPELLLLDEPLASLDIGRKKELIPYLKQLKSELDIPVIYVSHSADEIAQLADHILVMDQGRIAAQGPLIEMLARLDFPLSLGDEAGVIFEVQVIEKEDRWHMERVTFGGVDNNGRKDGELWLRDSGQPVGSTHRVRVLARDVSLAREEAKNTSIQNVLPASVDAISEDDQRGYALIRLMIGSTAVLARITSKSVDRLGLLPGEQVWAQIKSVALLQ